MTDFNFAYISNQTVLLIEAQSALLSIFRLEDVRLEVANKILTRSK